MKLKSISVVVLLISMLLSPYVNAAQESEHYIFEYDKDMIFDVKLTDNTVTWESLSGEDKVQKETDHINRKLLSNDVEVIQWTENDGTFVTVVFDRAHLNVISSGKYPSGKWLRSGVATIL